MIVWKCLTQDKHDNLPLMVTTCPVPITSYDLFSTWLAKLIVCLALMAGFGVTRWHYFSTYLSSVMENQKSHGELALVQHLAGVRVEKLEFHENLH